MDKDSRLIYEVQYSSAEEYRNAPLIVKARNILQDGIDMLNTHGGHGAPSVDRIKAYSFLNEAEQLIKQIDILLKSNE